MPRPDAVMWTFNPRHLLGIWATTEPARQRQIYTERQRRYIPLRPKRHDWTAGMEIQGNRRIIYPGDPRIADGKVYAERVKHSTETQTQACMAQTNIDASTLRHGQLIWNSLHVTQGNRGQGRAIAYGNLYLTPA